LDRPAGFETPEQGQLVRQCAELSGEHDFAKHGVCTPPAGPPSEGKGRQETRENCVAAVRNEWLSGLISIEKPLVALFFATAPQTPRVEGFSTDGSSSTAPALWRT